MSASQPQGRAGPFADDEPTAPGALDQYDEIDALLTERNSAVAEARLWLRRLQDAQKERDQAKTDLYAADKCLAEWQASYDQLLQDFRRLEVKLNNAQFYLDLDRSMRRHIDPFLPVWLQDEATRNDPVLSALAGNMAKVLGDGRTDA